MMTTISKGCGWARRWRAALFAGAALAQEETIKVGVLHSLSGTMAISETTLKDVMLMLIEDQNAKGGVLGKQLEAGGGRPGLGLAAFRRARAELIAGQGVDVVFGCWTWSAASRCCRSSRS